MRVLVDTHMLLWWLIDSRKLPEGAERIIKDKDNAIFVSAASIWEIAIKATLGQIEADPFAIEAAIVPSGFVELPITGKHAATIANASRTEGTRLMLVLLEVLTRRTESTPYRGCAYTTARV